MLDPILTTPSKEMEVELSKAPEGLQTFFVLFFDCTQHFALIEVPDSLQIHRRNFVRGIFAFIEAVSYMAKQCALGQANMTPGLYSEGELYFLRDEAAGPWDKKPTPGKIKYARTDDNFRFGIDLAMRIVKADFAVQTNNDKWHSFKKALDVRHRITHPKNLASLNITDGELWDARVTMEWVMIILGQCFLVMIERWEGLAGKPGEIGNDPPLHQLRKALKSLSSLTTKPAGSTP